MSRFPQIPVDQMTPEQRATYDSIIGGPRGVVRGPFPILLYSPELGQHIQKLGEYLRYRMKLSRDLFEFSVLIVARRWTAQFEWFAHSRYALEAGVSPAIVDAIAAGKVPDGMSADQALLHAFVTQVMESGSPSDDTFARARDRFGLPTTLDLIGMCGYYTMLAFVLNSAQVQVPEGGATLKPL